MKTLRIGIVNLLSTVGMAIGTALSGITFQKLGFYGVYATSSVLCIIGLLYGLIFIKEVSPNESENTTQQKQNNGLFNGFFNANHIQEAFKVTFKDGPHNRKIKIIMLMCIAFLIMGPLNGLWMIFLYILTSDLKTIHPDSRYYNDVIYTNIRTY